LDETAFVSLDKKIRISVAKKFKLHEDAITQGFSWQHMENNNYFSTYYTVICTGVWAMKRFNIEWDKEYGQDKRTGWSVCIDGSFVAKLERYFLVALIKSLWVYFYIWEKEYR